MNNIIENAIKIGSAYKVLPQSGNLVYEYNPFRNYRLSKIEYEYNNYLYSLKELKEKYDIIVTINKKELQELGEDDLNKDLVWQKKEKDSYVDLALKDCPIIRRPGELVDFITDELNFGINNPISIVPLWSYDNSTNLILNDGKNIPRLINSRFSPIGKNKYLIVDRKGENDTNIYDLGQEFDTDTSLYKKTNTIPKVYFGGTFSGGNLSIGNYHFYFKYADADGNETDFIAESGLVSVFIGTSPLNIRSGFRKENSYKGVALSLSNLDLGYLYLTIYYTISTADINENATITAYKIDLAFSINQGNRTELKITGYETATEIDISEINNTYQIASSVLALALCLNMLFLGNIHKADIDYTELTDISLRFVPLLVSEPYDISTKVDYNYEPESNYLNSYYNPEFIYNKVGYYPGEIYRFGVVYLLEDGTLSPVFNIRGIKNIPNNIEGYTDEKLLNDDNSRDYILYDENSFIITDGKVDQLENAKGVVSFPEESDTINIYGIKIGLLYKDECIKYLKALGIKGYFFVRLKRIPTTLCEAYTIGVDKCSHTPVVPINGKYRAECFLNLKNDKLYLSHNYSDHIYEFDTLVDLAAICPEYDINSAYLNSLFNGNKFTIIKNKVQLEELKLATYEDRHYYTNTYKLPENKQTETANIIGVEDNVKLVSINNTFFSARAGEESEAFRFEYVRYKNKTTKATNLLRGSFGPYLGITNCTFKNSLITIKIPDYSEKQIEDYFKIRLDDLSPYYAISDRYSIDLFDESSVFYRGDCYICQVTHRVNRNFQDPTTPTNDIIVDEKCWKDNFLVDNGTIKKENFEKINLGDVNAVLLGLWVTFPIRSNFNLCIRTVDKSNTDEYSLTGVARSFYPNMPISTAGVYKIPEALCYNKGFQNALSERVNFIEPDVPAVKNDFTNRILYSDISVTDAFKNGFRTFRGTNYRDYSKAYGQIIKLVELNGYLVCVCEHGILLIPVNERTLLSDNSGGLIYINSSKVLPENPKVLSDTFGSLWAESVIKTPTGIYGVDTFAKKIWKTDGTTVQCISDFKILGFLNRNITLTERETEPIIGIRNVKTHYNAFKHDVMFTFYDNLKGYEEKVWNLCWNELLNNGQGAFITFYSWVPSYSENIYNSFFSFDRDTSKWIAKLGNSKYNGEDSEGITLGSTHITGKDWQTTLHYSYPYQDRDDIEWSVEYYLDRDPFENNKLFTIEGDKLRFIGDYEEIKSELYEREADGTIKTDSETGRRILLEKPINSDKIVLYLNIRAKITVTSKDTKLPSTESYINSILNNISTDENEYKLVLAVIPEYNMLFLTTDFWKHGQSNTIDISDTILPTHWYGKLHQFEFEFVVADNPLLHKIFDNLIIISNSAEPDSFHYEIVGDSYEFAKDKKNMYIRLEATKHLYLFNGSNIKYDSDYLNLQSSHRINNSTTYEKSTLLPLYYQRLSKLNTIEDSYIGMTADSKDYSALSGGEITHTNNEYHIWSHSKAVNITDPEKGRLRGNMQYKEDKWNVLINPLNIVLKNEPTWLDLDGNPTDKIPVELNQNPLPSDVLKSKINIPEDFGKRGYVVWKWQESLMREAKIKDKWVKIRIRYSGEKLAVITAIRTLYSISYS